MVKVLHVSCGGLGFGGVSSVIFSIVKSLNDFVAFDCVVFNKRFEREVDFMQYGKLHRINAYNVDGKRHIAELIIRPFRLYLGIRKICNTGKYDVIHCHNNYDEGICLLAAKHAKVPVRIAHSHNTPSPKKRNMIVKMWMNLNKHLMAYSATEFVGCSKAASVSFFGDVSYTVIMNSIDLAKFNTSTRTQHDRINFIHVGRYTYQKNQEFLLEIFKYIHEEKTNTQLFLVGFGEDEQKIKQKILDLKLVDSVHLIPGNKVEVSAIYDIADYMIFPSKYEGFGIAVVEAQAKGVPCYVADTIPSEADVGRITYLSLSQTPEQWAAEILDDMKSSKKYDEAKINTNLRSYSEKEIAKQFLNIYRGF